MKLLVILTLCGASLYAQNQKDQDEQSSKERTIDKKFIAISALLVASTAYDIKTTSHCVSHGRCGGNIVMMPLFNERRPVTYYYSGSFDISLIYQSYQMKKRGVRGWWILPLATIGPTVAFGSVNMQRK